MKNIIIILFLLCSITIQAKKTKKHKSNKKPVESGLDMQFTIQPLQLGPWDVFLEIIDALTSPFRPIWGDYTENSMRSNPWPKTMFPRSVNDDIPALIITLELRLLQTKPLFLNN